MPRAIPSLLVCQTFSTTCHQPAEPLYTHFTPYKHIWGLPKLGYLIGALITRGSYYLGSMLGVTYFRKPHWNPGTRSKEAEKARTESLPGSALTTPVVLQTLSFLKMITFTVYSALRDLWDRKSAMTAMRDFEDLPIRHVRR